MANWATIKLYGQTGSTQAPPAAAPGINTTAFLNANPNVGTQTLQAAQQQFPQQTIFGRALARRQQAPSPPGTVQRGAPTGPLQTPVGQPYTPNRAAVGPEPDRLGPPPEDSFSRNFTRQLRALDNRAAGIPTPGDLGPWVLALVFLLFAVVPFNGYTRLQLVWYALTGVAHVPGLGDFGALTHEASPGSGQGNAIAQGNTPGGTPPPPKQEAPGGFTPRVVGGGL